MMKAAGARDGFGVSAKTRWSSSLGANENGVRMHVVIVGNGIAGTECALELRARAPDVVITVISEESDRCFARTALMYVLVGQMRLAHTEPYERATLDRCNVRFVRARVLTVDVDAQSLALSNGNEISYDRVLFATGSRPRRMGVDGENSTGVGHFVTLADLNWLSEETRGAPVDGVSFIETTNDSPYARRRSRHSLRKHIAERVTVVGGGLIGIEAVECALHFKKTVDFHVREEWYWPMAINARESAFIAARLRAHGCNVHLGSTVTAFEADVDGALKSVVSSTGTHPADCAVVCIGVEPNTGFLSATPIERDARGGVIVDDKLRSSVKNVFAAGDMASIAVDGGAHRVHQLWYTARDQGKAAARTILDEDAVYERGPYYNSAKLMDVEFTTVGSLLDKNATEWMYEESGRVHSTVRLAAVGGVVVGANILGRRVDHELLLSLIARRLSLARFAVEMTQGAFDTEFVAPLMIPDAAMPRVDERV